MAAPSGFDDIRPYGPGELPAAYDRLLSMPGFMDIAAHVWPGVPLERLREEFHACRTNLEFQVRMCYPFLVRLAEETSQGCTLDAGGVDLGGRYTFMSNHRDITIDPAFLSKVLMEAGAGTTCEIAIGDNLLGIPWVREFVRVTKSFIVKRGLGPRETLQASRVLSDYLYHVVEDKRDNVWIAQREGRAKDCDDRTQATVLKMMAMGGGAGSVPERLRRLHIVPLAISYEYDACDFLKARELQQRRDDGAWRKAEMEDVVSMRTGILGWKGRIHYHMAPCLDDWLGTVDPGMPKAAMFDLIAARIDREIHRNYRLYPSNYVAMDELFGGRRGAGKYTDGERAAFLGYIDGQVARIDLANKDEAFLRDRLLAMYANPAINHLKAISCG